jgi:hypothetical protein
MGALVGEDDEPTALVADLERRLKDSSGAAHDRQRVRQGRRADPERRHLRLQQRQLSLSSPPPTQGQEHRRGEGARQQPAAE